MRYYFHVRDGASLFDDEGMELSSLAAVREEAALSSVDMLRSARRLNFWSGEPWLLWVTDQPNGEGNTVLAITFGARGTHH
jgi:hypothetical protein